jgi:hypothetical protein
VKENIRETVRKLLRMAKGAGPEAESARKHAEVLMEKHGITIRDDDENYREVVPGVARVFWREQLLNGIARTLNVKLVREDRGNGRYNAVLVGYASDVAKVREVFNRLNLDLVVQCRAEFNDFNRVVDWEEASDVDEVYVAWQRVFLLTASAEISQRLMNGPDEPRPRGPVVYAPRDKDEEKRSMDEEIARILGDTEMLTKKFDRYNAREIQRLAIQAAKRAVSRVGVRVMSTDRKLLTANSSFLPPPPPPPEPTRFSELDL